MAIASVGLKSSGGRSLHLQTICGRIALHPGRVIGHDGHVHFVGATDLAKIHGIPLKDCIIWDPDRPETHMGRRYSDYIHIYPREDGNYSDYKTLLLMAQNMRKGK